MASVKKKDRDAVEPILRRRRVSKLALSPIIIIIIIIIKNAYNAPTSKSRRCTTISTMTITIIDKLTHARTQLAIQPIITTFAQQSSAFN